MAEQENRLMAFAQAEGMTVREFAHELLEATAGLLGEHIETDGEPFTADLTSEETNTVCKITVAVETLHQDETTN